MNSWKSDKRHLFHGVCECLALDGSSNFAASHCFGSSNFPPCLASEPQDWPWLCSRPPCTRGPQSQSLKRTHYLCDWCSLWIWVYHSRTPFRKLLVACMYTFNFCLQTSLETTAWIGNECQICFLLMLNKDLHIRKGIRTTLKTGIPLLCFADQ